ncbi:maleylpyruvate isomerase family mycothiol-dependent enzyme [Nocardia cyriacigeorgica]|uniref:Maleylpyruvate isomerase family mycothiol-dependent enzyme n=2 Tax=Nocardia cyriacigeorgica TaxID=135487 RepID=A0A6P1D6X3_9NOCA|nr:maleylpyruvate isomerase family mycothiol-dependent enzyme [Nocardia cyriacigeorgica]NEW51957.1 maleylpyruvate isomerase family mycothiol-dependent enzyme [Nocardia cyriacigeorgica]NEW55750.1 maleylpyruvate isomerase family mycothiol-dependent enzyme [Nocardia cyriacigeorgica]
MLAAERAQLVELLRDLSDAEWESPSLCAGWRVRDVVGHLLQDTYSPLGYAAVVVKSLGSVDKTNNAIVTTSAALSTAQLIDAMAGAGRLSKYAPTLMLADLMVHQQDIRRPLGRSREIPEDRLITVLDHPDPFALPGRRMKGLRFVATDVSWTSGDGPEVRGSGEAIALAVVGRTVALDDLTGDGVAELRRRCA